MMTFQLLQTNFLKEVSNVDKNRKRRQEQGPIQTEHKVRAKAQGEQASITCQSCKTQRMPVLETPTKSTSRETCT